LGEGVTQQQKIPVRSRRGGRATEARAEARESAEKNMRQGDEEYLQGTKNTSSVVRNTSIGTSNLEILWMCLGM
jgi:hypothetical protein